MASSKIEIYNMALGSIGITEFVASDTERSKARITCSKFYDGVIDSMLELFDWSFARSNVRLALASNSKITNWQYAYLIPPDVVAVRRIVIPGNRNPRADQRIPFEQGIDESDTRVLFCDVPDVEVQVTRRITDPNRFSPLFIDTVFTQLATRIAMPMTVSTTMENKAANAAARALEVAEAANMNQEREDQPRESEFLEARR